MPFDTIRSAVCGRATLDRMLETSTGLNGNKEFLAAIVESSEDAIIGEDLDGMITSWNRGAEKMFGYGSAEVIGQSIAMLHFPEDSEELLVILELIRKGQHASHFETTRRRKDGTRIDVSVSISPVHDEDGRIIGGAKIIRDITDQKRAEDILQRTEKLGIANRLAASVAHEINNPLAALTNLLFLARSEELPVKVAAHLEAAEQELARISQITTQVLGFYQENSSPCEHDVEAILDEALSLQNHRIDAIGIRVEKQYAPVPLISCHRGELRQAFVNLIGNAIDAANGPATLSLRLHPAFNPKQRIPGIRVLIVDTGCGLSPDARNHLFEPFYTTKGPTKTGLGLWMCQQIVNRHHGMIKIWSSQTPQHHGTAVALFFPYT